MLLIMLTTASFSRPASGQVDDQDKPAHPWWNAFVKWLLTPISFPFDERDIVDSELKLIEEHSQEPSADNAAATNERQSPKPR